MSSDHKKQISERLERVPLPSVEKKKIRTEQRKKPGMPLIYDKIVRFRISKELLQEWNSYVDRNGLNGSELIRDMMRRRIKTEKFLEEMKAKRQIKDL